MFSDFFAIETGVIPSPIFAFQIAQSLTDPDQAEEFWKLGEVEFYYSPHFRMQHAYYLANIGRLKHCFAKQKLPPTKKTAELNGEIGSKNDPEAAELNGEVGGKSCPQPKTAELNGEIGGKSDPKAAELNEEIGGKSCPQPKKLPSF